MFNMFHPAGGRTAQLIEIPNDSHSIPIRYQTWIHGTSTFLDVPEPVFHGFDALIKIGSNQRKTHGRWAR